MKDQVVDGDGETIIQLPETFDFNSREWFLDIIGAREKPRRFILDFSGVQFIDSSALGILLILNDRNGGDGQRIHLRNPQPHIRDLIRQMHFDRMFKLEMQREQLQDDLAELKGLTDGVSKQLTNNQQVLDRVKKRRELATELYHADEEG